MRPDLPPNALADLPTIFCVRSKPDQVRHVFSRLCARLKLDLVLDVLPKLVLTEPDVLPDVLPGLVPHILPDLVPD